MTIISMVFVGLVALEHLFIAWVEIFAWTTRGPKMFPHLSVDFMKTTKEMAANQGIYNVFLAAGLVWSLFAPMPFAFWLAAFFLGCVVTAGVFGAATSSKAILFKQALPAAVALAAVLLLK